MKIENKFEYKCAPQALYEAIAQIEKVTRWWTDQGEMQGKDMVFYWRPRNWCVVLKVLELVPGKCIKWLCLKSNMQDTDAWTGSTISFQISLGINGGAILTFVHDNYKSSPCFSECTAGWAFVLGKSLKNLVETGSGEPFRNGPG